jgi:hypothetical protein
MSARALAFRRRPLGDDHDNDADNDAWNLSKVIYDQNGYAVCDSGHLLGRHSTATNAAGFVNLVMVDSSQRYSNPRMIERWHLADTLDPNGLLINLVGRCMS